MTLVNIELTDHGSFEVALTPADATSFVVSTVTVVDESLSPVWMLAADNVVVVDERSDNTEDSGPAQEVDIRGAEVLVERATIGRVLGPSKGRPLRTITFGKVPGGFIQLIPSGGQSVSLDRGKTYHIFVNGSENGNAATRL